MKMIKARKYYKIENHYCPCCAEKGRKTSLGRLYNIKGWEHWYCQECLMEFESKKKSGEWRKILTNTSGQILIKERINKKETEELAWV